MTFTQSRRSMFMLELANDPFQGLPSLETPREHSKGKGPWRENNAEMRLLEIESHHLA